MLSILENEGFTVARETVEGNNVATRLENGHGDVIILEREYFPPDEIENNIYVITGELDIELEMKLEDLDCEVIY